ncbi:hypothetical protein EST38_g10349 [Candolleomyces aberdarensis]|uniref:Rad21/Rec8-like protein N-terminal domain-containing protein n=1 Tax=Candolleomyces aberdarensis TaxID=2316362 RepID=A0A4Q2DAH9_9AGAR|nr:hypothetical protein EST38_g10349 [Candolleomyces aberdarensis]
MFFTQELLARRDSGFGLLWLAATLGSKSSFKKLPRRSVLTADIGKLCDLISEPVEPLALRLSSNLMFGVVRVYKVKQEILLTDATNCVTALKKVVHEMNTKVLTAQLQMAQTALRPSAVTIEPDSRTAHVVDYDAFVVDWDEYLNIVDDTHAPKRKGDEEDDDDFDPTQATKKKQKAKQPKPSKAIEAARNDPHTLTEHHEHVLSATFDLSFAGDGSNHAQGHGLSSSHPEAPLDLGFDDNPFALSDGLDLGGDGFMLGDELARELGWGSPAKSAGRFGPVSCPRYGRLTCGCKYRPNAEPLQMDMDFDGGVIGDDMGFNFEFNAGGDIPDPAPTPDRRRILQTPRSKTKNANKENIYPRGTPGSRQGSVLSKRGPSPANSFGRLFLSQDQSFRGTPLQDVTGGQENGKVCDPKNGKKRARLLLDARTELTDDELKIARAQYLEFQNELKRDMMKKQSERDGAKLIEDLMWGVPQQIREPSLIDFWQTNFKVQVEARSGLLVIHHEDERPVKRRKRLSPIVEDDGPVEPEPQGEFGGGFEPDMGMMMDFEDARGGAFFNDNLGQDNIHRGSSEEPGQGRRVSRPSSVFGGSNIGLDLLLDKGSNLGSQKSSLFPWDNAGGPSSSSANAPFGLDDNIPIDHVEVRLRGSSRSRRSSVAPSQSGVAGGVGFSPIVQGTPAPINADYEFNVEERAGPEETQEETQKTEVHLATLERNSFNFLEYAKMQYRSLPDGGRLKFEMVVPQATSTRHVAAAAFYHCLVLATKDLIRLEQPKPYDTVVIDIFN